MKVVTTRDEEVVSVRQYFENTTECRRKRLLNYSDPTCAHPGATPLTCCDFCAKL